MRILVTGMDAYKSFTFQEEINYGSTAQYHSNER